MRQRNSRWVSGLTGVLLCGLCAGLPARAEQVTINISATGVEPPCTVTDGSGKSQTEVDFDHIQVDDVNTGAARKPLPVRVTCEGSAPDGKGLKMYLTPVAGGTMAYAGRTVLGTSLAGLGIELTDKDGNPVTPESWVPVSGVDTGVASPSGTVSLQAGLVSEKTADLKGGSFTASASVVMAYQ